MGAYPGKFGTPRNRLGDVEILRISRISRISRKIGIQRDPDIPHRRDFGFLATRSLVFAKYFGVSAKLAACLNPPYPTIIFWAGNVYPGHLRRVRHICVAGRLSRGNRNIPKRAGMSVFPELPELPEFPGFPVKCASDGLRIFPVGRFRYLDAGPCICEIFRRFCQIGRLAQSSKPDPRSMGG